MKIYQQLHTLSARKRNFLLGVTFVVLTIPSYIAVLILNLAPLSENVQSFLTIVCLIGGVVFASYGTYRIYKMVPSSVGVDQDPNAEPKEITERRKAHQQ